MRRQAILAVAIAMAGIWCAQAVLAQDPAQDQDAAVSSLIGDDPDRFLTAMTDLIAGFGGPQGLTVQGIEEHIAIERAAARATALRRMLAMDLDADSVLDRAELRVNQRAASAAMRGRMERAFLLADTDGDGRITPAEMATEGQRAALRALGEEEAAALRALLSLDRDGNAALTRDEIAAALVLTDKAT